MEEAQEMPSDNDDDHYDLYDLDDDDDFYFLAWFCRMIRKNFVRWPKLCITILYKII